MCQPSSCSRQEKLGCFHSDQLHWRKRRGREEVLLMISMAGGQGFWRVFCFFIIHTEKLITTSVKRCVMPQMGIHSLRSLKLLEIKLHFSPTLMLLAERGRQTERLTVIKPTYITYSMMTSVYAFSYACAFQRKLVHYWLTLWAAWLVAVTANYIVSSCC